MNCDCLPAVLPVILSRCEVTGCHDFQLKYLFASEEKSENRAVQYDTVCEKLTDRKKVTF